MEINQIIQNLNFSSLLWQIIVTLCFILADVIVGFISAVIQKNVDSQKMREGLLRKILLIIVIILSFIIQYGFNITIISRVVCIYIVVMEIISILENLKKAGIDLKKLGEILKIKNEESDFEIKQIYVERNIKNDKNN